MRPASGRPRVVRLRHLPVWKTRPVFIRSSCLGFSPRISSFFPRSSFSKYLGGYRELVARPPALQGPLSDLVRSSRFSVLFPALDQQAGCAKLGRAGFRGPGVLASAYWQERLASSRKWRAIFCAGVLLALLMSMIALDTDLLRSAGVRISRRDPADAVRGWKSAARAVEKIRSELEPKLGEPLFVIADQRDRASEMAFYFQQKRAEGPGHPPVYIVESQDITNQFSFWPRYDGFVEVPAGTPLPDSEVYTEEGGINPFMGRHALYIQSGREANLVPRNIQAGFQSTEKIVTIEIQRFGVTLRTWQVFLCRSYRTLPL